VLRRLLQRHLDLARLASLSAGETVADSELQRLVDAAPAQVRELLQTEGYFSPQVQVSIAPSRPGEPRLVRVDVQPGDPVRVAAVRIELQNALQDAAQAGDPAAKELLADLRRSWTLASGQAFRNPAWADAKSALLARLRAGGYAAASHVLTQAEVDADAGTVALRIVSDSGPLFRAGRIVVEGVKLHDDLTVLNMAGFGAGAPLTEARLLDYQERLQKSGLFAGATVGYDNDLRQAGAATVTVRVSEQVRQQLTLGAGFSANTGPRAQAEWQDRRLMGWPASTRQQVEWGRLRQTWNGEVSSHPGPHMWRNRLGVEIERLLSDQDIVLSQRLRLGRSQDRQRIERFVFIEAERASRASADKLFDKSAVQGLSLNGHGTWRNLDNVILPTHGFVASAQLALGRGHDAQSRGAFGRAYVRVTGYWPLGQSWYGQARIEAGQVFANSATPVPEGQLYRAGGDDSVRGYAYRSLGPLRDGVVGSGRSLFTSSIELARPILPSMPSLWGAVFVDAGNVADSFSEIKPALGAGIGVRWRSPVGPLRADWAYGRELGRGRLHISVGIAF
jgi:translocation and assembly module TamA